MKPLSCKIRTLIEVPLDINNEQERLLMEEIGIKVKHAEAWCDGFLIEIQPITSKFADKDYSNEQTVFYGLVWSDEHLLALPLSEIKISGKEIDRLVRKEWN